MPRKTPPVVAPAPIDWETAEHLADRLHVDVMTVYRRVKKGQLPAHRVPGCRHYLFDPAEVDRFIKEADIRSKWLSPEPDEVA